MFQTYLNSIYEKYQLGAFSEHTFRADLENLFNTFVKTHIQKDLKIIHEPKRSEFGAPDFKILDSTNNIVGYVECKNITEDIQNLVNSPQIQKYLNVAQNFLLTNYIEFILFRNREIIAYGSLISRLDLKVNKIEVKDEENLKDIFAKFFLAVPENVKNTKKLSLELAKRTRMLYEFILEEMQATKNESNQFYRVYKIFKAIVYDLEIQTFADIMLKW